MATQYIRQALVAVLALGIAACSSSSGGGGGGGPSSGTLQLSATTYSGPESGNITITVSRTGGTEGDASVDYETADGTATTGDLDYTGIPPTTLSWMDGEGGDKTFDIIINNDGDVELTESLTISLSNVSGATLGARDSATVSIMDNDSIVVIGTVTGPGASLAMVEPGLGERMLAGLSRLMLGVAEATIGDPVPSVTVTVYEVDNAGDIVGSAITTSTTDGSGAYTLAAPLDAPASKYIVRASDGMANTLDARISSATTDVDPVSDATSFVIADRGLDLTELTASEVAVIQEKIGEAIVHVDSSGTASQVSAALVQAAADRRGVNNIVNSSTAAGSICGNVTKGGGATNMANIEMVVLDHVGWQTRARTYTAADGSYCMNVPAGDYVVGARNEKSEAEDPDKSASEWYNAAGNGRTRLEADAVTVGMTQVNGIDFDLVPGARIEGTMTTYDAGSAEGVNVAIRDYETFNPVTSARVGSDNTFRVNVPAGDYVVYARNFTLAAPYAVQFLGAAGAYNNYRQAAARYTLAAGDTLNAGMSLAQGYRLSGTILDAPAGNPVANSRVRIDTVGDADVGGPVLRPRTDNAGVYRAWLKPDSYSVDVRGSVSGANVIDLSASNQTFNYSTQRAVINGVVEDGNANPVGLARILLYADPGGGTTYSLVNQELSNTDGSFTLHGDADTPYKILYRIDGKYDYGSVVRPNATAINAGTTFTTDMNIATVNNLGTQTLPTVDVGGGMGWIIGSLAANGTTGIQGGQRVEIRQNNSGAGARFFRTRTNGDGTYRAAVPAGFSYRVRMIGTTNYDDVAVTNDTETVQDHP